MTSPPAPLPELETFLKSHADWRVEAGFLKRIFVFPSFLGGIDFVQKLAALAEKQDHHPDLDIRYTKIHFSVQSHDAGTLTSRDVKLATAAEALFQNLTKP